MYWKSLILTVMMLFFPIEAQCQEEEPVRMEVKFTSSFQRTYPRLVQSISDSRSPGPLLYPEVAGAQGWIAFYGPEWFIEQVRHKFNNVLKQDGVDVKDVLICRLWIEEDNGRREIITPLAEVQLRPTENFGQHQYAVYFEWPIEIGEKWQEGHYLLELGMWYTDGDARKTLGVGLRHFEIKNIEKGTDDEINLLTNAWLSWNTAVPTPQGLREILADEYNLMPLHIPQRILEIDPHDVWARHMLAQYHLQTGIQPQKAVDLYKEILKDVEAGQATRLIILLDPFQFRRHPLELPDDWSPVVQRFIHLAEDRVRECAHLQQEVRNILEDKGQEALIDIIRTPQDRDLYTAEEARRARWAIRIAGQQRVMKAEPVMIEELRKLPAEPGQLQIELCVALARMHNIETDIRAQMMIPSRARMIIESWRSGNAPDLKERAD